MAAAAAMPTPLASADPQTDRDVAYCQDMAALGHLGPCSALLSYGMGVCTQFDQGNDWYSILKALDAAVVDQTLSSDILVAAVTDICPWDKSKKP